MGLGIRDFWRVWGGRGGGRDWEMLLAKQVWHVSIVECKKSPSLSGGKQVPGKVVDTVGGEVLVPTASRINVSLPSCRGFNVLLFCV